MSLPKYIAEVVTASGKHSSFKGDTNSEVLNKALECLGEEEGRILVLKKEDIGPAGDLLSTLIGAMPYIIETDIKKKSPKTKAKEAVFDKVELLIDAVEEGKFEQASDHYQQLGELLHALQTID